MFSAEQYRAKAAEFQALLMNIPRSSNKRTKRVNSVVWNRRTRR